MWNRKEVKAEGKKHFKNNYWLCVVVCFLLAFLGCEYASSATVIHGYDTSKSIPDNVVNSADRLTNLSIFDGDDNIVTVSIETSTAAVSYIVKLAGSVKDLIINNYTGSLILALIFIIEFIYIYFVCNPLIVGSRKFYIKNHTSKKAKLGLMLEPFKHKSYLNIVKTTFLQSIFLILWTLTIVGVFIKYYEYRMIPFILADDPETKDAFALSKKMMKGNKWKMFKFDLSYIGWYILDGVTLGFSGILYSNPYKSAAATEIYLKLKESVN